MKKNDVDMLEKLCLVGDVLRELKHNLRISPDGAVALDYITERLERALEGKK